MDISAPTAAVGKGEQVGERARPLHRGEVQERYSGEWRVFSFEPLFYKQYITMTVEACQAPIIQILAT